LSPSAVPVPRSELRAWCAQEGFRRIGFLPSDRLPGSLCGHPEIASLGAGIYLLAALSCYKQEPEDLSTPGDPHGLIAPFARRNHYREAVLRLNRVARRFGEATGLPRRAFRVFSNSTLPEKPLAVAAGLGSYGRNALVLAPGLGSLFVIAGIFIASEASSSAAGLLGEDMHAISEKQPTASGVEPLAAESGDVEPGRICGKCRACQEACPVGALAEPGCLDEGRCLQAQAGRDGELPEELAAAWGFRLYGCQVCQEVCPYNRRLRWETPSEVGELGPSLSLRWVLERSPEELAGAFRGTALGMAWISKRALQRNALVALGHRFMAGFAPDSALDALLERYTKATDPQLARAAAWAAKRIRPPVSGVEIPRDTGGDGRDRGEERVDPRSSP
jgi:epoxyqueuosine reductase